MAYAGDEIRTKLAPTTNPEAKGGTLDPADWDEFRALAHAMLNQALDQIETVREGPVWRRIPPAAIARLDESLPVEGTGAREVCATLAQTILPYPTGNMHPGFFGWVHGSGTPVGVVAEMMAAAMNANVGGRHHGAVFVERQVIDWCRQLFGFPSTASGIVVTGTSMATIVALAVARHRATAGRAGSCGLQGATAPLVGYTSQEAHSSIAKAFELLGLGSEFLRAVPVDDHYRMETGMLAEMVEADLAAGRIPFCVIATVGTVNTGAIDDLGATANICDRHGLWLHIDGAFGALAIMSDELKPLVTGIERADSLAFDFHKWMHVPYDAGCVLVRDGVLHRETFAKRGAYLESRDAGLAGGEPWFCDYGPELSRGFRALKVWATIKTFGTARLGEAILDNCMLAADLAARVEAHPRLELLAPVSLAIVCFRVANPAVPPADLDRLNAEIVSRLQARGIAAPSTTRLDKGLAIRVNITNHRTKKRDIDTLVEAILAEASAVGLGSESPPAAVWTVPPRFDQWPS